MTSNSITHENTRRLLDTRGKCNDFIVWLQNQQSTKHLTTECEGTAPLVALNRSKAGPTKRLLVLAQHYCSVSGANLTAEVSINYRKATFVIKRSRSLLRRDNQREEVSEVQTTCILISLRTSDSSPSLECHQTVATQSPQGSTLVQGQHFGEGILVSTRPRSPATDG